MDAQLPAPFDAQLVPLLEELVSIDSINPSLVPDAAGEAELARFVADWFRKRGVEPTVEDVAPGRPNVIAVVSGRGHGRSVILNAHLDTVGAAGMHEPFSAETKNGRLYGRGAMDTKGGLAALMVATAAAAKRQLSGDVIFAGVVDEEFASLGTESMLRRFRADAAIVAEPTGLEVHTCHKGFMWLEVETTGIAAHGSKFQEGVDAIVKMGKFLVALEELGRQLESRPGHPLLGPPSVHASLINGGQELSSYPASCRVSVERRTLPNESHESVQAEFQELLDRLTVEDPKFAATCRTTFSREPLDVGTDSDIAEILGKHVHTQLGREAVISGSSGWTDAALLATHGIPSIVFGPAGEGLHASVEWVDLESVRQCCSIVLAAITEFCGVENDSIK